MLQQEPVLQRGAVFQRGPVRPRPPGWEALPPGMSLGILGGGQLGRMLAAVARRMGYEVVVLDPDPQAPAADLASEHICSAYDDPSALQKLAERCVAVTTEFENVPAQSLEFLQARGLRVGPDAQALRYTQDRGCEKQMVRDAGVKVGEYRILETRADLEAIEDGALFPGILKTARFGYDGKGQREVRDRSSLLKAWQELGEVRCILERKIDLAAELSCIVARAIDGSLCVYPCVENRHRNGILDQSIAPATQGEELCRQAQEIAAKLADAMDYVGVMAVEFFVEGGGDLLVNEIAPRPHNSGHHTIDACVTSQFEQQLRALCGLALGDASMHSHCVMTNLLGDLWLDANALAGDEADSRRYQLQWSALLERPGLRLHLYGKQVARRGRKMGHVVAVAPSAAEALQRARGLRELLQGG